MKNLKILAIFTLLTLVMLFASSSSQAGEVSYKVEKLTYLEVNASINPATLNYLQTNFEKLSREQGDIVFIKLDTPGGLVSTTKEILTLIKERQKDHKMSVLFISHDLSLVAQFADRVLVMHQGRLVESGTVKQIFKTLNL